MKKKSFWIKIFALLLAFMFLFSALVHAEELNNKNQIELSYKQALDKILANNNSLDELEDTMSYLDELRKDTISNRNDLYVRLDSPFEQAQATFTQIIKLTRALMSYENQMSNYNLNKKILSDTSEFALLNYLINMQNQNLDANLYKNKIALQEKNYKILKLKLSRGMASDLELINAQNILLLEKYNLVKLNTQAKNTQQALNKLLGFDLNQELKINFDPERDLDQDKKYLTQDINSYVAQEIQNSPVILLKRKILDQAKFALDTHDNLVLELKSELVSNYNKASRDYHDTQKNLESSIIAAHNDFLSLKQNFASLESNLKATQKKYDIGIVKFNSGLISEIELAQNKLELLQSQSSLEKNKLDQVNLIFKLNTSYLL